MKRMHIRLKCGSKLIRKMEFYYPKRNIMEEIKSQETKAIWKTEFWKLVFESKGEEKSIWHTWVRMWEARFEKLDFFIDKKSVIDGGWNDIGFLRQKSQQYWKNRRYIDEISVLEWKIGTWEHVWQRAVWENHRFF